VDLSRSRLPRQPGDDVVVPAAFSLTSHIDIYEVNEDGTLDLLALPPSTLAGGLSGLVVT
jgi:hypothetical protein